MGYRSPARCSFLRPNPFHGSSVWSHHPCVIDVSSTIDTDGPALPPFADISIFGAHRSLIEAPPSLAHSDFATFHLPAQLMADLSFPFYFLSSF